MRSNIWNALSAITGYNHQLRSGQYPMHQNDTRTGTNIQAQPSEADHVYAIASSMLRGHSQPPEDKRSTQWILSVMTNISLAHEIAVTFHRHQHHHNNSRTSSRRLQSPGSGSIDEFKHRQQLIFYHGGMHGECDFVRRALVRTYLLTEYLSIHMFMLFGVPFVRWRLCRMVVWGNSEATRRGKSVLEQRGIALSPSVIPLPPNACMMSST
jgi:hypothetical protein